MNLAVTWPHNQWPSSDFHLSVKEAVGMRFVTTLVRGTGTIDQDKMRKEVWRDWLKEAFPAGNA